MSDIEAKLQGLEQRVAKLEGAKIVSAVAADSSSIFPFVKLDETWANAQVRKDPKFWDGESMVGKTFSECSAEYLEKLAGYYQYMAERAAGDPNPKCDAKGKPYFERDKFTAKLARTWAAFKRSNDDPNW